jgi:RNA polymerase sigma-70 factor (ECF subfamily)
MAAWAKPQRSVEETSAPYSDAEWVSLVREGDVPAFKALVLRYSDKLCAYVYNHLGDAETTRELVQDLFLWIWRHRHEWEIHTGLTSYLYRSARNRAISRLRHERVERSWQERVGGEATPMMSGRPRQADEALNATDLRLALARAVDGLPDRCRQVFLLSRAHGMTYGQIAETLGIAPKTVEIHIGRALAELRLKLGDWLQG